MSQNPRTVISRLLKPGSSWLKRLWAGLTDPCFACRTVGRLGRSTPRNPMCSKADVEAEIGTIPSGMGREARGSVGSVGLSVGPRPVLTSVRIRLASEGGVFGRRPI